MQVQNGMDDINIKTDVTNNVESGSLRTEVSSESVKGAEETVSENESHELERDAEEESGMVIQNISKEATSQVELQDPIQECSGLESAKGIIAKKGYVVYEINLDGELDTCLDNSKRPLPKRLKVTCYGDGRHNPNFNLASRTPARSTEANCRGIE